MKSIKKIIEKININNPDKAVIGEMRDDEIVTELKITESTSRGFWTTSHAIAPIIGCLKNENGGLQQMTWVIGSAIVVALVIIGAMVYAPDTAENFWDAATSWIRGQFGF